VVGRAQRGRTRTGGNLTLRAEVDGDGYPEFAREQFHLVVHGARPETVDVRGTPLRAADGRFVLPNAGEPFTVELTL
jgi:alpha-glucosidase